MIVIYNTLKTLEKGRCCDQGLEVRIIKALHMINNQACLINNSTATISVRKESSRSKVER